MLKMGAGNSKPEASAGSQHVFSRYLLSDLDLSFRGIWCLMAEGTGTIVQLAPIEKSNDFLRIRSIPLQATAICDTAGLIESMPKPTLT